MFNHQPEKDHLKLKITVASLHACRQCLPFTFVFLVNDGSHSIINLSCIIIIIVRVVVIASETKAATYSVSRRAQGSIRGYPSLCRESALT
mmetsp:Transcript_32996/g.83237  ORF Transcript_32996/g.83237 Transcript_32996/m.83237 type:complete len:91 (-) Transcript_32996:53-325(-)